MKKMYILTIDTSDRSIVGVARDELGTMTEVARELSSDSRHHAETLTPMVAAALASAGIEKPDAIVAGTGPAAFTGLRAGLMTARALARAWDVPLYGVSSLEVLALAGTRLGFNEVLAVIDARRKELFALRARPMGGDDVAILSGPEIVKPADLAGLLARAEAGLVSSHPDLYPELASAADVQCEPAVMASLALSHVTRQEAGEDIDLGTEPQYLRRPDIHGGGVSQPAAR
ncbi:MAG: tRNA (adenosine(37)-N6)-threonylcarbamoyltransferase complex dimerization subunit type 1 TsaB [Ancrocorticia sp.]